MYVLINIISEFCTPWPKRLTGESIEKLFPIEILRRYYVSDGASNFDHRANRVTLKVAVLFYISLLLVSISEEKAVFFSSYYLPPSPPG